MNARLQYYFEFTAGVVFNDVLTMGTYRANVYMVTVSTIPEEHNIAFERLKYYIGSIVDSAVFISAADEDRCRALQQAGVRIITLPEEPVDQVIGIMLFCKLNAIMENRMSLLEIEISSDIGGNMVYLHADSESIGPLEGPGWWQEPDLSCCHDTFTKDEQVMRLGRNAMWRELELNWPVDATVKESGNTIVFADFNRDAPK